MNEMLLDDYAFAGLDPVFSELMEHPEWMPVVDRKHGVEKVVWFSMTDRTRLTSATCSSETLNRCVVVYPIKVSISRFFSFTIC